MKRWLFILVGLLTLVFIGFWSVKNFNFNGNYTVGQKIDSLNRVIVYYNGGVNHVKERNTTKDGYNIGLKYQCVEFVKRYYYEYLNHKMPDSYGHAKSFFNKELKDGALNEQRNLIQYTNQSNTKPKVNDLLIFGGTIYNRFGHVAIVSKVNDSTLEIIQQNPGPFGSSRASYKLEKIGNKWEIMDSQILGWLRKKIVAFIWN